MLLVLYAVDTFDIGLLVTAADFCVDVSDIGKEIGVLLMLVLLIILVMMLPL